MLFLSHNCLCLRPGFVLQFPDKIVITLTRPLLCASQEEWKPRSIYQMNECRPAPQRFQKTVILTQQDLVSLLRHKLAFKIQKKKYHTCSTIAILPQVEQFVVY